MSDGEMWPWVAMALLGAWHGLNPGMGWLFAAALGMQEGKGSAAWRALPPLALGHALAVAGALGVAVALGWTISSEGVRWIVAGLLVGFGLFRLVRAGHPRYGGMRVGARDLTIWSFLMASAHGAGLMVMPFFVAASEGPGAALQGEAPGHGAHVHGPQMAEGMTAAGAAPPEILDALGAVALHTGAYLLVTGLLAVLVVSWLGLRLLRSLWVDLDRAWAGALILTGIVTLLL
jgi:hypothetical protein